MRRTFGLALAVALAVTWLTAGYQNRVAAQDDADTGVIAGVVTSADGPEAGVWVIAETDDLETVFRKIVVTDDDGRPVPAARVAGRDLRRLGPRLRSARLHGGHGVSGRRARAGSDGRRHPAGGGAGLSVQLLAGAHRPAGRPRISWHRRRRQWHQRQPAAPERMDQRAQGLPAVPPGGQRAYPRGAGPRSVRFDDRRLGRPHPPRPARVVDEQLHHAVRPAPGVGDGGGLE